MKEFRNPQTIFAPPGYSHHVEITGNERILVLSGQIGIRLTAPCRMIRWSKLI